MFIDVFVFYRDWEGRKQRVALDAVIAPTPQILDESLHKYDLDKEPVPLCAIEVISPSSRNIDENTKRLFYAWLGIEEYLLIDVEDEERQWLDQIVIKLWRVVDGVPVLVEPDAEGFLTLTCINVRLRADGRKLVAQDAATGETLLYTREFRAALRAAEQALSQTEQALNEKAQALTVAEHARQQAE